MQLYDYQENGVLELAHKLAGGVRKCVFQLATGGGKTITFSAIAQRFISRTPQLSVLIIVHRDELLQQTRRTLWDAYKINCQVVVAGMRTVPPAQVYVAMVESLGKRLHLLRQIGLVIIDECHIANFNKLHASFPTQYIVGFTATPLSADKKNPLKAHYQDIVCGVDIDELIRRGKLVQNITRAPAGAVQEVELKMRGGEFDATQMGQTFSKTKHILNLVHAYEKWAKRTKTIVFNVNVNHSLLVLQAFKAAGYHNVRHLDGTTPDNERKQILRWYKHTHDAVLLNVGVATTGFDEPTIETVMINRATASMPLWLQMTGRGGRIAPGKAMFNIIDMGANAARHGDWCQPRNWKEIFFNPPEPGKGKGVAPIKTCPACMAVVPAQARQCFDCGYIFPVKKPDAEVIQDDFVVLTKNIDIPALVSKHQNKKQAFVLYEMGRQMAAAAKDTTPEMTDDLAHFILGQYQVKIKEWGATTGSTWRRFHDNDAGLHLFTELKKNFPKWQTALLPDPVPVIPTPVVQMAAPAELTTKNFGFNL